jgi:hypothetical protein
MPYTYGKKWAYKKSTGERLPKKQAIAITLSELRKKGKLPERKIG